MTTRTILHPSTALTLPVAEPDGPVRATIYALHGGGLSSGYWDCPNDPELSLVELANTAGFRVAYPDRPGHRINEDRWPGGIASADEAALHAATILELWPDEPVVLLGQSAGSMVALRAAATGSLPRLAGVEYSGVGLELDMSRIEGGPTLESFWGPARLYPAETFSREFRVTSPTTGPDGEAAQSWATAFFDVAPRVRVPVRVTMADHEAWWGDVPSTLATIAAGLSDAPSVETNVEYQAGHNLSVGLSARAYHLGVLAFFERCLRRAGIAGA